MGVIMLRTKILAAALTAATMLPLAAGASTVNPASNIANGGSYDMLSGPYLYGETFRNADVAGFRDFTFMNTNTSAMNIILTTATVNALAEMFKGGISFTWLTSGLNLAVAQSTVVFAGTLDNWIGAGSSDTLRIAYGDPTDRVAGRKGHATFNVNLEASPVPLPAGGLLLAGALAGIAALRRRKSA